MLEKFVGEIRFDRVGINPVALARVSELEPVQITRNGNCASFLKLTMSRRFAASWCICGNDTSRLKSWRSILTS